MNGVTFNRGMLCVESPDGELHPIGEVGEIELDEAVSAKDAIPNLHVSSETTLSIELTQDQVNALFELIVRAREHALDLVRAQGYSRIAHLARHARKHRTRKKKPFPSISDL